jgi:phospholipid/cholesterol/gamma-HCH transport system permease protein
LACKYANIQRGDSVPSEAVGNAVNETVVFAFMALFVINVVVTAIGIQMTAK